MAGLRNSFLLHSNVEQWLFAERRWNENLQINDLGGIGINASVLNARGRSRQSC